MPKEQYNNRISIEAISIVEQICERDNRSPGFVIEQAVELLGAKEKIKADPNWKSFRKLPKDKKVTAKPAPKKPK